MVFKTQIIGLKKRKSRLLVRRLFITYKFEGVFLLTLIIDIDNKINAINEQIDHYHNSWKIMLN